MDAANTRSDLGYLPPKVEVSGPHARVVSQFLGAQLSGLLNVEVVAGRQTGADIRVDWELKRPDGKTASARKVVDDESWRHSSAATADWFAPRDPVSPDMWQNLRENAHVRTVHTEIAGVTTHSTPSNISAYRTLVNYDLRRIEARPGEFVQEFTVKVHLKPGAGVDSAALDRVRAGTHDGVNSLLNRGYRLPSGDQFHLNVEFTDNAADAHTTVEVKDVHSNQLEWNPTATPGVYAHEMLHFLGAPDEYVDATRVFLANESRSGVHTGDGSMMGTSLYLPDAAVLPRHLWSIEHIANSQVMVPDTPLDAPGTAPRPAPEAATPSRPAPPAPPSTSGPAPTPVSPAQSDSSSSDEFVSADEGSEFESADDASVAGRLPAFFQDGAALGTIAAAEVNGGPQIEQAVAGLLPQRQGVTPRGVDQIAPALSQNFESFLGNGRNFQIKVGKDWFEVNVRAKLGASTTTDVTPKTKVDFTAQSGNTTTQTGTLGTAGDVGGAVTLGMAVGATGTVAGKAALARPVTSTTTGTSTTDQRAIRSSDEALSAKAPVTYQVTLTDARGIQVGAPVEVTQEVGLEIPGDLIAITPADPDLSETPWTKTPEHAAPEAVTDLDTAAAFEDIARQLHPSITKLGAPGRTALQEFLSPTTIRDNLGAALNGWVVSPDLSSPHGSRGGVVRMRAVPLSAELVGTTSSANLRVNQSAAVSTGLSAATKSGFDGSVTVGGGATVKDKVGGSATATVGYTARTTESSSAGTSATVKSGIQVKGELGLYRTTMRLEFQTPHGTTIPVTATGYLRAGLPEAGAANLPVPADTATSIATPTPEPKFPPPYLASAAAAGAVKVGSFEPAAEVQSQVEGALRGIPGFEKFLPSFADAASDPRKAGKNMQNLADQAENLRKLTTELSPAALQSQMDSLLGPGVQVQLKRQGMATNDFINVTVKARLTNPVHLGQADQRNVRGSAATGPKLDSATTTQKGWTAGVEAKVVIPAKDKKTTATPTPSVGAKYTSTTAVKTSAGPTVGSTRSTGGSPNAQLFRHDVTFDIEVTKFSRNRAWVKRLTPGSPWLQVPEPKTIAKTGVNLREISGQVNLWVSDGSTLSSDPAAFAPGTPSAPVAIPDPPTIQQLLTGAKPRTWPSLHVEAVANTEAVRDAAIAALNASGDTALTVPGTEARNRIDKLFSPESIKANLPTLLSKGMTEGGLKYGRRVADRVGAVGVAVGLSNPKLVSISDDVGLEAAHTGGFKAGESKTDARSVDVTAGLNTPMRPTKGAVGSTALGATAKWTPWSKTKTTGTETTGGVDRNRALPATGRTVLVQLDADVTVVGESRASNTVRKGSTSVAASVVTLPGGVFVRVSEDDARDMGVLPSVETTAAPAEQGTMAPPATLRPGEPAALGLGLVEQAPDLSSLVPQLRENLGNLGKNLLPKSVLDDSMNNLRRLTDLTSDASVKALVDSALDGGIPLLVHDPGVFGKDTYQVTLKAVPGQPVFQGAVNDGVDIEHTSTGTQVVTKTGGGGTGWGVGLKVPGSALPKTGDANVSANVGGSAAVNVGQAQSYSVTESTTKQLGQTRAASGPAARYTVPVTFELVVEKGSKEIGRASTGQVDMAVRVPADNQKITAAPEPAAAAPTSTTRPAEDGTPANVWEWQQASAKLPPLASVENLRGARLLQDAAVRALRGAGANTGITGKGTGAMNALRSGLALESLQPSLPGMLDGAFEVPGLHEASVLTSQHANVKVYAKLVNPRLEALSDGVALSDARSTVGATSSEAKQTESHDVSVAVGTGGVTSKKPDIGFSAGGVEIRHASEDSAAVSAGTTHNPSTTLKTEGRTGLVSYDVEYRVVADLGKGRTGVVELKVPGSAQVRMRAADAEAALGRTLPDDLDAAQTGVHEAAQAWREAEVAADEARHAAQTTINDLAPQLAQATTELTTRAGELATAEQNVADATTRLGTARQQRDEAAQTLARAQSAVDEAANLLRGNELSATVAEQAALAARLDVDQATAREQAARAGSDQSAIRDAADARRQAVQEHQTAMDAAARTAELTARSRDLHSEAVIDLGTAQARHAAAEGAVRGAEEDLRQAESGLAAARSAHDQAVRAEQELRAAVAQVEAEVERTRAEAGLAQQAWWQAKAAVDEEVGRFNGSAQASAAATPMATAPTSPAATTTPAPTTGPAATADPATTTRPAPITGPAPADLGPTATDTPTTATRAIPPDTTPGKKVIDDESWRHSPATTADWFAPNDPASPDTWQDRREGAHVRTVDTQIADVTTDSTPSKVRSYQGLVNYDLRRIETSPGKFVQDYTVKVFLKPGVDVSPAVMDQVRTNARDGVNSLLNQGFRLPSGDRFHVNVEFTDNPADAHTTIEVGATGTDQTHWNPDASPAVLAHETLHYLGVPDEYRDPSRVFLEREGRSGVHAGDGGMMGLDVHQADAGLRPRHLWLIERTATSQVMVPDTRLETAGPATTTAPHADGAPDATRPSPQDEPPAKRARVEDAGPSGEVRSLSLADVPGKYNQAFADLADGPVELPTRSNYLARVERSAESGQPVSFVVNMIVGHGQLGDLPGVIDAAMRDAGELDGKVVFVIGVNGRAGQEQALEAALEQANAVIAGRSEPIALVSLPPFSGGFPYGKMRNDTMSSPASEFAVGALMNSGTHPYFAVQDFDTGSRAVASGRHIFAHVAESLRSDGTGANRPLMASGGYRVGDHAQLIAETNTRLGNTQAGIDRKLAKIAEDLGQPNLSSKERTTLEKERDKFTKDREALDKARTTVNEPGFAERFEQAIRDDMDARARQALTHPMLPYTPEPNLFVDAVVPIVDPEVRFGDGAAEFTGLGKALNKFFADEVVAIHTADPAADPDDVRSAIEVDAQNGRNPVRGPAFVADFVGGAVETDLSRIALGLATTGKLPQSHIALTGVMDRFFGADDPQAARVAKKGAKLADFRDKFGKRDAASREPLRPGQWDPNADDIAMLGGAARNTLNLAVSARLPGEFGDVTAGIAPEHKTIAAVNLAMSANDSAVKRTFGQLHDVVLPEAKEPRPRGLFQAVHDAVGRSAGSSAADLRTKVTELPVKASAAITGEIANFEQQNPFTAGDLVNAFVEPAPEPFDDVDVGEMELDPVPAEESGMDVDLGAEVDVEADMDLDVPERAEENARWAANARDLAGRMIATHLKRPLVIHDADGSFKQLDPFGKKSASAKPVHLDAIIGADGKTEYQPRAGTSVLSRPAPPADNADPSTEVPPRTDSPSSSPVLPSRALPSFFQDGVALGTITPVEVKGGPEVTQAVTSLLPQREGVAARGLDQIAPALSQNFESFLGSGRNFQIKVGKDWFEANVKATPGTGTEAELSPKTKIDVTAVSGNATSQTGTLGTAGEVGGAVTLGMAVGATGTVAGKAALARPVTGTTTGTSTADQRMIRSGEGAFNATVPVNYQVTLTDARGNQVGAPVSVAQDVTLYVPGDALTPAEPGLAEVRPEPGWATTLEHPAPEAVTDLDAVKAFEDIARQLHPTVTKLGAPGRAALQEFLSPTTIRDNLGAALSGWVVSPDLSSPHGSRGGVVRMRAVPLSVELVGTTSSVNMRLHESTTTSTGLSATTRSGFDASVAVGGGASVANQVGGGASVSVGYSARTTESSSAGTSATVKTGIQVKGDLGLYRTKMRLEFETPHGTTIPVTATGYLRAGLPEAGAANLPVPQGTPTSLTDPTPEPKFPPPYLASAAAAGAVKVGAFAPAAEVQSQVEQALRGLPGFEKFLPSFADAASDPRKAGKNMQELADQAENLRKLATELSPTALKSQMDSLLGPGVQVQLKRQGLATNDFVNVTVKARLSNPVHLGQADARSVRGSVAAGPKLDSATTTQKGWSVGVEAKVVLPAGGKKTTVTPTPSVGAKYTSTTATKTTAGPTVGSSRLTAGSPNAQLFQHDVTFEVEVTKFSRNRAWVKRLTPGSPFVQVPTPKTVAKTGVNLPEISGKVNLWVSDGSALSSDPVAFAPAAPVAPVALANPPSIHDLLTAPKPPALPFLHVEAVANTEAVRDAAIAALSAGGDTALTVPGTEARNRIDKLFSPENIRANLPTLVGKGMTEGGLKYGRRVTDRVGAVGVAVGLSNPKLVSISDDVSVEAAHTGGFKAGESKTNSRSADVTAGLNTPMRPTKGAVGSTALGGAAKWTPWSKTRTKGSEAGGSVERNQVLPSTARTVLVQLDAQVTVVGESRASNTVYKGSSNVAGSVVTLPGGVFVRVSEDVAREMGVLPSVEATAAPVEQGTLAPPSTLRPGEPGALGLGMVERAPDLSALVPQLRRNLGKLGKNLLPKSVLDDSMNNLRRLTDLTSEASVKALVDSAMDGGVPLLVHDPGVFGKDTYQVTLKAVPGEPVFDGAVNDGVEIEHAATGTQAVSETRGGATGWGAGLKVPGSALPKTGDPNVSANVGGSAAANVGQAHSHSTTASTTNQLGHLRIGSGPAARYTVPVTFELVVEKGTKEIGRATSGQVDMTVRVHADNQKTTAPDPQPFAPGVTTRPAEAGAPASAQEWQRTSATLPPLASVENLRGAQVLQDAAVQALTGAGANTGITGKGTGAMNALRSGLALESLQPNLPGMLDGAFEVPGLHEASLTTSQHAQVKVYAKLVNPRLEALSDGVQVLNPRATVTTASSEAKHTGTGDVSVAVAPGGVTSKKPDIGFSAGGVEVRHASEDSAAVSGGTTHNPATLIKAEGRTGLIGYDVEYRVVADLGRGRVGVVDVSVPGAAQVRMFAADAEAALGRPLPEDLGTAQTGVQGAAKAWREAEVTADQARHAAQTTINDLAPRLAQVLTDIATRTGEVEAAEQSVADATTSLDTARRQRVEADQAVERARFAVDEAVNLVHHSEFTAALAEQTALAAQLDVADATAREQAAREQAGADQTAARAEAEARHQAVQEHVAAVEAAARAAELAARAHDVHAAVVTDLGTAEARQAEAEGAVLAAQENLRQARAALDAARERRDEAVRAEQDLRAEVTRAEAEVERTRADASAAQQAWWQAKAAVDQEVDRFNAAPVVADAVASSALPELSLDLSSGSSSLTFQQMLELETIAEQLTEVQAARAAQGLPAPVVEITGDHAAHVAELLAREITIDIEVAPGRPDGADLRVRLDQVADVAPPAADTQPDAQTDVLDNQLAALTTAAMDDAPPLMRAVNDVLELDPQRFINSAAGLNLLRASVVLHTRTAEIADLIDRHGVDAVADAFIRRFERPIIETAQRETFTDLSTDAARGAFTAWAHQLWDTIENHPQFTANPDALADQIFHHDKGYNRATTFVQTVMLEDLLPPPTVSEAVAARPSPAGDTSAQAMWLFQVLADAKLISADSSVQPDRFTAAVIGNRAELEAGIGVRLDDQLIAELREELQSYGMVDEDVDADVPVDAHADADTATHADTEVHADTGVQVDSDTDARTDTHADTRAEEATDTAEHADEPGASESAEIRNQLAALTAEAMENATPLMRSVETILRSNPHHYVQSEAGLHLLRASAILHTRTDEIAGMILRHGVDAVADAFVTLFERPILETVQRESFVDLGTEAGRAAFGRWAHQLWDTVENAPQFTENPEALAADIFNHDKGYNRATTFAQHAALATIMGPPALAEAIDQRPVQGDDTSDHAAWVFQVFADAGLIAADGTDTANRFTELVLEHRADLEARLGRLDDRRVAELRQELVDMVMLDDDTDAASASPAGGTASNPLHSTEAPWFEPRDPVSSEAIARARAATPATSWVRGEDAGVLDTTTIGPSGIDMRAWRGPIAYDNRVMNVDGAPVRDFTVRLHLNNAAPDVEARARAGVEELFNQGYRLPSGEQFHVTVEFTGVAGDAHATIDVTAPGGRAGQLTWPADTDARRLAHEVGHFLGLRDEYFETGPVKPIFQHQDGRGRVVDDNSPMTAGIDAPDARLRPRHLQLVENRMKALETINRPAGPAEARTDVPAPNMPPKRSADEIGTAEPAKRGRYEEVLLVNENGVHNAAFANLANGRTLTPITADNYLDRTRRSIENNEPPAFVVSMIVRAGELNQLDEVVNGVMANTNNMNGRVAFVLGVNAKTQQEIDDALAAAASTVNSHPEPIALVSVPHGPKGFKFGDTRNATLYSNAHEFAVHALAAGGTHPYVSIMDFDAGDRRTRQGEHVFDHVTRLMDAEEVGTADGPDIAAPLRPLMVGGGYRITVTEQQLRDDVMARIDGDAKTTEAMKQVYRAKLTEQGFFERFEHMITADMYARRNQQAIHPLLPYTPEPNLFFDALVPLADPSVKFGAGAAEFGQLGQSLNRFYARELAALHAPDDPARMADAVERAKVDAQNNRHPLRGQAFASDFVAGDTGTDLSRIAYGLIKDGKLPQSHTALPNVTERFFDGKSSKSGTKFAEERARLTGGDHKVTEPLRPPGEGEATTTWKPPAKMEAQLGKPDKNRLNPAVSAPMPAPFDQLPGAKGPKPVPLTAGIQKDQKVAAAHGLVASDHISDTQRQLRYLADDVLARPTPPPTTPNGLYAAVAHAVHTDAATLRRQVVNTAASDQNVVKAAADFTVNRPMHRGHLHGALVENVNWSMRSDPAENTGAGNARDLLGHLIASQLGLNVVIHQGPGSQPVVLAPMGGLSRGAVEVDLVMVNGQVTYRPHQKWSAG